MAVIQLLFVAVVLLTAQVSCEKSVAFVIHDTLSLYEDIEQVKNASQAIIDLILKEKAGEIEDYVLVTFNHKDVTLQKKTPDPKELTQAIDAIKIQSDGNDSCSDNTLSGVSQALKEIQDGSLLYVFTDASASDYKQFEEVKTLCDTKKSQIFFIVSGHCGDISSRRYQVYHNIAAACRGQAITIHKDDITEVPKYFEEIINGKRTVIESTVVPASAKKWKHLNFDINDFIESPIIIASGIDVNLTIVNKKGVEIIGRGKWIAWTRYFKAFQMARSREGVYTIKVKGASPVDVTVVARTNFTFEFGFSIDKETSLDEAYPQPFTDIKTHLLIFVKDPEGSAEVQGVELHDTQGNVSKPLVLVKDNVYATEKFNSSAKSFKIKVVAKAKKTGKTVRPSEKSLVEPMQPTSVELLQGKRGDSFDLHCRLPGNKTKSQISWYTKKPEADDFSILSGQTKEVLHVANVSANDHYKCIARSTEGYDQYNARLDLQVGPHFTYPPALITQVEGKPVTIECKIHEGSPRPDITWQYKHVDDEKFTLIKGHQGETLNITQVKVEDSGDYQCIANNTLGTDMKFTKLLVTVPPKIFKRGFHSTIKEGISIDLPCRILKGIPKPVISWYSKRQDKDDYELVVEGTTESYHHIANPKISTHYKCVANNSAGIDEHIVHVVVEASPEFMDKRTSITVMEGEPVTINCKLSKGSEPLVKSWESKPRNTPVFKVLNHGGDELHFPAADPNNAKVYKCVAKNSEGRAEKITELIVQAEPAIVSSAPNKTALENESIILECRIKKGFPVPTITWQYKGPETTEFVNIGKTSALISLVNVQAKDAGQYRCVMENVIGRAEQTFLLVVIAPPKIVFNPPNSPRVFGVEGDAAIRLSCDAVGYPTPTIMWLVDDKVVGLDKCNLPMEKGPCDTLSLKWFYDSKLKECRYFIYGGCDGNENRFNSKEECQGECVPPAAATPEPVKTVTPTGKCKQPKNSGPCKVAFTKWFFDTTLKKCRPFIYGGCLGNDNRFDSEAACQRECGFSPSPTTTISPLDKCHLPMEKGPCNVASKKWYYDSDLNICLDFNYGGCGGNLNRFDTVGACISGCVKPLAPIDICKLPKKKGPCLASITKWYYDDTLKQCLQFNFGGCLGNGNQFSSEADCKAACATAPPKLTLRKEPIYVEGNALIIQHPQKANSSKYHSYVCRATNDGGRDSQTYDVVISDHIEFAILNDTYALLGQPYGIKCAIPFTDSSSVTWYKNSEIINGKTGPILHLNNPSDLDDGNYTCRVIGLTHSPSHTVQVKFGVPPVRNQTSYNVQWNGGTKEMDCYSSEYPEGEYKWSYNGRETGWSERFLQINNWGEYTCSVTNPLGSFEVVFKVTTPDKDCRVPKSLFTSENAPLVLDFSFSWPMLSTIEDYYIVQRSEKLQLFCQDESQTNSYNVGTKFPKLRSVNVSCYEDDLFQVDDKLRKISEFMCQKEVKASTKRTNITCLGENTELVQVGFSVNNFTEVYQSCVDMKNFDPLYTKMNTIPTKTPTFVDNSARKKTCVDDSKCCYESRQLVNEVDVSFGPAQNALILSDSLNAVEYCRMKNDFDWDNVEMISRSDIPYTVWTGVAQYRRVSGTRAPKYLWKILRYYSGVDVETIVIIHENVENPGPKLCKGVCGKKIVLFEPSGNRTYCCSFEDLRDKLGININLDEN